MKNDKNTAHGGAKRSLVLVVSLLALLLVVAGGTLAWLTAQDSVSNTFTPAHVSCEVKEDFNGTIKSNVNVTNTSDIAAFIRVKLVTYRVNDAGQRIGGTATIPTFKPGAGWAKYGDFYYYTLPVAPNATPEAALIGTPGIELKDSYKDADGGKQVIEVMAEAIQSQPDRAIKDAWGTDFSINPDGSLNVPTSGN